MDFGVKYPDHEDRFDTTAKLFNSTGLTPKKSGFTPKFARYEKMVLRWYGFYREAVDESQVEQELPVLFDLLSCSDLTMNLSRTCLFLD